MKTFFNRVDFADLNFEPELTQDELQHLADVANAKLEQWLRFAGQKELQELINKSVNAHLYQLVHIGSAIKVVADKSDLSCEFGWWPEINLSGTATHRALLIDIQELPTKPCKHEPAIKLIKENGIEVSLEGPCRRCGVPLKAKWEEA